MENVSNVDVFLGIIYKTLERNQKRLSLISFISRWQLL